MADVTLEKLFESKNRARLLKLFFMSPRAEFGMQEILRLVPIRSGALRKELKKFLNIGIVETGIVRETALPVRSGGPKRGRSRKKGKVRLATRRVFFANKDFFLYPELKNLISKIAPKAHGELMHRIKRLGDVRLAILSGVFLKDEASRADIIIVGDRLKRIRTASFLKRLQSEVGKDLNYAVMSVEEFQYRIAMNDRFVRDVLDGPHEKLIDKLEI